MRPLAFLIVLVLVFSNTALLAKSKQLKQLENNLAQWEQFRWQGMVQVKHGAFTLRKFYVLAKNNSALRLDILDSGVLGLNAKPMVVLYIKDRIVLDAPAIKELQGVDPNWFVTPDKFKPFFQMTSTLLDHSDQILSNRRISLDNITYLFDKKYRLTEIKASKMQLEAKITYNRKNKPDKIFLFYRGVETAIFTIDERSSTGISVRSPEPDSLGSDTHDLLDNGIDPGGSYGPPNN